MRSNGADVEWRAIETAPKDGTFVLIATPSGFVASMQFCRDGFWRSHVGGSVGVHPTHWMPLPPPPTSAVATEDDTA